MQVNHLDLVKQLADQQPAERTVAGALAFCLRVVAALPSFEAAGLLLKPAGENIIDYKGQMVSAGRICYPDGQLYKVLTDIPTTNGPQWADDGTVDPARYVRVTDALGTPGSNPPPPPPRPVDLTPITQQLAQTTQQLTHVTQQVEKIAQQLAQLELIVKDAGNQNRLFFNDVVAHFDELKRIIAGR